MIMLKNKFKQQISFLQLFVIVYFLFIFFFYSIYLLHIYVTEWLILHQHIPSQIFFLYLKDSAEPFFQVNSNHTVINTTVTLPFMDINKAQTMSLQEKITYTLAILDINLLVGIDLKGFSDGIYGIVHLGAETSSLSQNILFNQVNPYSVTLKIPFSFLHNNLPYSQELVNFWTSTMEPCRLNTTLNLTENNLYGFPQTNTFSTHFTVFKNDTFSFSFGIKIPFEAITTPKKYTFGCTFNIF